MDAAEARRVFGVDQGPDTGTASDDGENENSSKAFTILLTGVPESMRLQPEVARDQVAEAVGEESVRLMEQSGGRPPLIVYGSYSDAESQRAQADLRRFRAMEIDGRKPFLSSVLVREAGAVEAGERPARHDLRQAKRLHGEDAVYTLQIGVYAREDDKNPSAADLEAFREAAEEAVERLRREGEEAFYYHGPNGSMVTVGVFNDSDLDVSVVPPIESTRLRDARARHPHNLLNGRGVREMVRGEDGSRRARLQESRLVLIPD